MIFITLLLLGAVLAAKYGASVHIVKLKQQHAELERLCVQNEARQRALVQDREAAEMEERHVQDGLKNLERRIDDLKRKLEESYVRKLWMRSESGW